jgi:high-affinity iron transporter
VLGIQPFPVRAEGIAWIVYLVPVLALVLLPQRRRRPAPVTQSSFPATERVPT